jgi:hypothetical protein
MADSKRPIAVEAGEEEYTDKRGKRQTRPIMQGRSRPMGQCGGGEKAEEVTPIPAPTEEELEPMRQLKQAREEFTEPPGAVDRAGRPLQ